MFTHSDLFTTKSRYTHRQFYIYGNGDIELVLSVMLFGEA